MSAKVHKMEIQTIYLHIGLRKTGTTALQQFLFFNRHALKTHGILYPKTGASNHGGGHHPLANAFNHITKGQYGAKFSVEEYLEQLKNESKGYKTIIISSEIFSVFQGKIEQLTFSMKKLANNIKIIIYLRRHDSFLQSLYSSYVKARKYPKSIDDFISEEKTVDFHELCSQYSSYFGKENLIVKAYEKEQLIENDIISDFFNILNIDLNDHYIKLPYPGNISLNLDALEFKRCINSICKDFQYCIDIIKPLQKYSLKYKKEPFNNHQLIHPNMANFLVSLHSEGYQKILTEYTNNRSRKLFYEPINNIDEWHPYKGLTTKKITQIFKYIEKNSPELVPYLKESIRKGISSENKILAEDAKQLQTIIDNKKELLLPT